MGLKRLEAVGFKSFADPIRLEFNGGITCVVGPNGCGKSNIVDAIKWVLGDLSPRSLRAHEMADVIFAGSEQRKPMSVAEVTILFDNSSRRLPIDFSEVEVSRRLYRDGTSEYFLNRAPCRLRDIRELFLDTGLGVAGYNLIEQGKIDRILSSNPETRRELFEEAAGIAKYTAHKEECERNLARVKEDLNQIDFQVESLGKELESLRRQAGRAAKIQDLRRRLEISVLARLVAKDDELSALLAEAEARRRAEAEEREALERTLEGLRGEIAARKTRETEMEKEQNDLRQRQAEASRRWTKFNTLRETLPRTIADAEIQQKNAREALNFIRTEQARVEQELAGLPPQKPAPRKGMQDPLQRLQDEWKKHRAALEKMEGEKTALEARKQEIWRKQSDCANREAGLRNERARIQEDLRSQRRDIQAEEEQLAGLIRRQEEMEKRIGALREEGEETARARAEAEREIQEIHDRRSRAAHEEGRVQALYNEEIRKKEGRRKLAEWLAGEIPGILGILEDIFWAPEGDDPFLAEILSDRRFAIVCETREAALAAIAKVRAEGKGWVECVILKEVPVPPAERAYAGRRLRDSIRCEAKFSRLADWLFSGASMDEGVLWRSPWVAGGSRPPQEERGESSLRQQLAKCRKEREELETRLQQQQARLADLKRKEEETNQQLQDLRSEESGLAAGIQAARKKVEDNRRQAEAAERELETMEKEAEKIRREMETHQAEERELENRLEALASEIQQARAAAEEAQRAFFQAEAAGQRNADGAEGTARRRKELQENLARLKEREKEFRQRLAEGDRTLEKHREDLEAAARQAQEAERELEEITAALQARIGELSSLRKEIQTLEEKERQTEDALNGLTDRQQAAQEAARLEGQREEVLKEFAEKGTTPEEARQKVEEARKNGIEPEDPNDLESRLRRCGSVDPEALEGLPELEQRYNFLAGQRDDLLKSKQNLEEAMAKIHQQIRDGFVATYESVRKNFQEVFSALFEGGRADLVLTQPEDPLNTGVEIMAQPPGKKFQSLALLSGGEKALTALALLFAFYLHKPAPFCVLDEVDAPLDAVNVTRFTRLLAQLKERSQFLVITHNTKTPEVADLFYGVTMEAQSGVTRILSMKLGKNGETRKEAAA